MRIIRFRGADGRVLLGEELGDGTATVLLDADGVLGSNQRDAAHREILRGKRAIVADDDEGIRQAVGAILGRFECECTFCKDGDEAIRAIDERPADVIVSDIAMPRCDGYEVFAAARRHGPELAVVLLTGFGYDPNHAVVRACREGCESVLYKPFTPQQLVEKVADAMRANGNGLPRALVRAAESVRIGTVLAPLTPREVLAAGRNYGFGDGNESPLELFMKPRGSMQDPGEPIRLPTSADGIDPDVDAEGELAVVIGAQARNVNEADALAHILGYAAALDVTARCWRKTDVPQAWMRGKGFDTFCPIGPAIVTSDELADSGALDITTSVNGTVVRRGNTSQMHRPVARLVSEISRSITLFPGTVLLTGAPPPVGDEPLPALHHGDEVCVEIEGIGRLVNPVTGA
ncbi:MAG: fumarylacetoacetate hydrolase family protein [Planctomycetota bacterium]